MALSKQKMYGGPVWPLGFVQCANNGTPVCIMFNIDPSNLNAPGTPNPPTPSFPSNKTEYTPTFKGIGIQGYQPGANNNGMVTNNGNVYLLSSPAGGTGNRSDSGSIIKVIPPGTDFFYPPPNPGTDLFSPYTLFIDVDIDGEGALITGYGGGNP